MKTSTTSFTVNRLFTSTFIITLSLLIISTLTVSAQTTVSTQTLTAKQILFQDGVEYASLNANATHKTVFINWVTATEGNNNHFEVERSMDAKNFVTVAILLDGFESAGSTGKSYKFKEDAGAVRNGKTVYYRLKQIDADSQVSYSKVMALQLNKSIVIPGAEEGIAANQSLLSKQSIISIGQ